MATDTVIAPSVETLATFRIPDANLGKLRDDIAKLSRKSMKLMGTPITMSVVDVEDVENKKHPGTFDRFHIVTVTGARPKLAGWEFVAAMDMVTLDDGQTATLVRNAPGKSMPVELRNHTECDHCHTHRARKTLYVVQKTEAI